MFRFQFLNQYQPKPKNKFSLDQLKYLTQVLYKHQTITPKNKHVVIETVRQIAELMTWGDKKDPAFFDYFLEKMILPYFLSLLRSPRMDRDIKIQLMQTLSIMLENFTSQTSIYYMLSNNYMNDMIQNNFDFSDEEILAYYISLLKSMALRLDTNTLQFFFNRKSMQFPLFLEAVKFFNHKDHMVRTTVRTLTLSVCKLNDPNLKDFLQSPKCLSYFLNLFDFLSQETLRLSFRLPPLEDMKKKNPRELNSIRGLMDDSVGEVIDQLFFLNDLMSQKLPPALARLLVQSFLDSFIYPILVSGIMPPKPDAPELPSTKRVSCIETQTKPPPQRDSSDDDLEMEDIDPSPFPGVRLMTHEDEEEESPLKTLASRSLSSSDISGAEGSSPKEKGEGKDEEANGKGQKKKEEKEGDKKEPEKEEKAGDVLSPEELERQTIRRNRLQKQQEEERMMREQSRKETAKLLDTTGDALTPSPQAVPEEGSPMYSQVMSVFLLMNVAHIYTHKPLINMVATAILHPSPPPQLCFLRPKSYRDAKTTATQSLYLSGTGIRRPRNATLLKSGALAPVVPGSTLSTIKRIDSLMDSVPPASFYFKKRQISGDEPYKCSPQTCPVQAASIESILREDDISEQNDVRKGVLELLLEEQEDDRVPILLCLMNFFFLRNTSMSRDVLRNSGLMPLRFAKAKRLMDFLLSPQEDDSSSVFDSDKEVLKSGLLDAPLSSSSSPFHTSSSSEGIDEDDKKAKELLAEAARKTGSLDLDEEGIGEFVSKNDPGRDSQTSSNSGSSIPHTESDTTYWFTFVEHLMRMLHDTIEDGRTPKYSLLVFQVVVVVLKELLACPDTPLRFCRFHNFLFIELFDCFLMRIRNLSLELGMDRFLTAMDLAVAASDLNTNFDRLRKDIGILLLRQPNISPAQRTFRTSFSKDITRLLSAFLVLHELFFNHFARAKGYVERLRQTATVSPPSVGEKEVVNLLDYKYISGIRLPPPPSDLPTPKKERRTEMGRSQSQQVVTAVPKRLDFNGESKEGNVEKKIEIEIESEGTTKKREEGEGKGENEGEEEKPEEKKDEEKKEEKEEKENPGDNEEPSKGEGENQPNSESQEGKEDESLNLPDAGKTLRAVASAPNVSALPTQQAFYILTGDNGYIYLAENASDQEEEVEVKEEESPRAKDPLEGLQVEDKTKSGEKSTTVHRVTVLERVYIQYLEMVYDEISGCVLQLKASFPTSVSHHLLFSSQDECLQVLSYLEEMKANHRSTKSTQIFEAIDGNELLSKKVEAGRIDL